MAKRKIRPEEITWAATFIYWEAVEDDYERGEQRQSNLVLADPIWITARSPDELIEELGSRYGTPTDARAWAAADGRLETSFLVDDENVEASERDVAAWQQGRKRLWNAHITVEVVQVSMHVPGTTEIAEVFGIEENE